MRSGTTWIMDDNHFLQKDEYENTEQLDYKWETGAV